MKLSSWLVISLCLAVTGASQAADFHTPAPCSDVWAKLVPAMLKAGFQPTAATNKDAGILVFEYRQGAGTYVDKDSVRSYTTERPGALTSYQVVAIQQASAALVSNSDGGCAITMTVDFLAYKTSFLQTGWIKLASNGSLEASLVQPVLTELEKNTPAKPAAANGPEPMRDVGGSEASDQARYVMKQLFKWFSSPEPDEARKQVKVSLAIELGIYKSLPPEEKALALKALETIRVPTK